MKGRSKGRRHTLVQRWLTEGPSDRCHPTSHQMLQGSKVSHMQVKSILMRQRVKGPERMCLPQPRKSNAAHRVNAHVVV